METISTYKSVWQEDPVTGTYSRTQRARYPLEFIGNLLPAGGLRNLLGRKAQGVDYYRYYSEIIKAGDRQKWVGEAVRALDQLKTLGVSVAGKKVLDISGEPGFFGKDLSAMCDVTVTSFADSVAQAIAEHHQIGSVKYDYNADDLGQVLGGRQFEVVFNRYSIGFCEDLPAHVRALAQVVAPGGTYYVSFSPASRAVCARWMFDDYTYLRQFTRQYMIDTTATEGFELIGEFDEGSYRWDADMHPVQRMAAKPFLMNGFFKGDPQEELQGNIALVFRKS